MRGRHNPVLECQVFELKRLQEWIIWHRTQSAQMQLRLARFLVERTVCRPVKRALIPLRDRLFPSHIFNARFKIQPFR
jgi:hypothetical protein